MTLTAWRLAWRQQRWELAILIGGCLLLAAVLLLVAWQMSAMSDALAACMADRLTDECASTVQWGNRLTTLGAVLPQVATVVPLVVGLMLGAPLVAREIERRTALLAWTLSPSRPGWFGRRILPLAVLLVVALAALAQASELLVRVIYPDGLGFINYGSHGPLIVARGLATFGLGTLLGVILGRSLPAILVTIVVAIVVLGGIELGRGELMRTEASWIDGEDIGSISMIYDMRYRSEATGELITEEHAFDQFPEVFGPTGSGVPPGMTQVYFATAPDRYPSFVARESAALGVVALATIALALVILRGRRPE